MPQDPDLALSSQSRGCSSEGSSSSHGDVPSMEIPASAYLGSYQNTIKTHRYEHTNKIMEVAAWRNVRVIQASAGPSKLYVEVVIACSKPNPNKKVSSGTSLTNKHLPTEIIDDA